MGDLLLNILGYILYGIFIFFVIRFVVWDIPRFIKHVFFTPYPDDPNTDDQNKNIKSNFWDHM